MVLVERKLTKSSGGVEFRPLPTSDLPGVVAARKARAEKRNKVIKIGVSVVVVAAALAALSAYLVTPSSEVNKVNDIGSEEDPPVRMARSLEDVGKMEEVHAVSDSNWQFSSDAFKEIVKANDGNIIFSPYSVSSVMAMITSGAKGDTLKALIEGMKYPELETLKSGYSALLPYMKSDGNITLETGNSVFLKNGMEVLKVFRNDLQEYFDVEFKTVDFAKSEEAAKLLNTWIEKKTHDKIKDMFKSDTINGNTAMVLVNAIYFKGDWKYKFPKSSTKKGDFFVSKDNKVETDMMFIETRINAGFDKDLKMSVYELPYKGERVSMYLIVPEQKFGLDAIEKAINSDPKLVLKSIEKMSSEKIQLSMPKFKMTTEIDLNAALENLGMGAIFDSGAADFSGMTGGKDLYVSKVFQKAFIEVNEEGSEAAAATGAVMMMRSMPIAPRSVELDQPFMFLIKDKVTDMVLFQGKVVDPTKS